EEFVIPPSATTLSDDLGPNPGPPTKNITDLPPLPEAIPPRRFSRVYPLPRSTRLQRTIDEVRASGGRVRTARQECRQQTKGPPKPPPPPDPQHADNGAIENLI